MRLSSREPRHLLHGLYRPGAHHGARRRRDYHPRRSRQGRRERNIAGRGPRHCAAETDATKRALAPFGKPFGLALYGSGKTAPSPRASAPEPKSVDQGHHQVRLPPDDTTPIPRPSHYFGRRQDLVTRDRAQGRRQLAFQPSVDTSIVPPSPDLLPAQIDKSVLT